jgi:hypothetical protein
VIELTKLQITLNIKSYVGLVTKLKTLNCFYRYICSIFIGDFLFYKHFSKLFVSFAFIRKRFNRYDIYKRRWSIVFLI